MSPYLSGRLTDVLTRSLNALDIQPDITYQQVTVRLHHRGVVLRGVVSGSEIKSTRQYVARTGQLILSRIDARNGAIGLVPLELDGAVVTNDFWLFDIDEGQVLPKYLDYYVGMPDFVDLCKRASEGTTNRVRLQPEQFLALPIPLPALAEQRRIVTRVEALAGKIAEARGLRRAAVEAAVALLESAVGSSFAHLAMTPRRQLSTLTSKIGSGSTPAGGRTAYPTIGIPFIRSLNVRMRRFQWADIAFIDEATHQAMAGTHVKAGDVLLNITGASIGRVACAPDDLEQANVNQHVAIIRPTGDLNAQYLMYWLSQPKIQDLINETQKGATRQGFTKAQIAALDVPIPTLKEQRRMVDFLDGVQSQSATLDRIQTETQAELEALLPAVLDRAFRGEL